MAAAPPHRAGPRAAARRATPTPCRRSSPSSTRGAAVATGRSPTTAAQPKWPRHASHTPRRSGCTVRRCRSCAACRRAASATGRNCCCSKRSRRRSTRGTATPRPSCARRSSARRRSRSRSAQRESLVTALVGLWTSQAVQGSSPTPTAQQARALELAAPGSDLSGPAHFAFGGIGAESRPTRRGGRAFRAGGGCRAARTRSRSAPVPTCTAARSPHTRTGCSATPRRHERPAREAVAHGAHERHALQPRRCAGLRRDHPSALRRPRRHGRVGGRTARVVRSVRTSPTTASGGSSSTAGRAAATRASIWRGAASTT